VQDYFKTKNVNLNLHTPKTFDIGSAREITFKKHINTGIVLLVQFDFDYIFDNPFGSENFINLNKQIDVFIINNIPKFTHNNRGKMKRFIVFIDEVYNHRKRVVCLSAFELSDVVESDLKQSNFEESFAWDRAYSRLLEMQGTNYKSAVII